MQDITPPNQRSIRNIQPPRKEGGETHSQRRAREDAASIRESESEHEGVSDQANAPKQEDRSDQAKKSAQRDKTDISVPSHKATSHQPPRGRKRSLTAWIGGIGVILAVIAVVGFGIASQFASAEITIIPHQLTSSVDSELTAFRSPEPNELGFEFIMVDGSESAQVPASGETEISERATGEITIYNEHSSESQTLVANTRFESPEGFIFRISEGVTVPGMDGDEPGRLEVEVTADEPGDRYNIGPSTFTIPGFEGTPQFEGFYAESSSTFQGGRIEIVPEIMDEDREAVEEEVLQELLPALEEDVFANIPEDFILFSNALFSEHESSVSAEGDGARVTVTVSVYGVLFNKRELSDNLLSEIEEGNGDVVIQNWEELDFQPVSPLSPNVEEFDFTLSGPAHFVWQVDTEALASDLAGVRRANTENIYMQHEAIDTARTSVRPGWARSLPASPDDISIIININ